MIQLRMCEPGPAAPGVNPINMENPMQSAAADVTMNVGKGCIRYSKSENMDFAVVEQLLSDMCDSTEEPC